MESTGQTTPHQFNPGETPSSTAHDAAATADNIAAKVSGAAQAIKEQVGERASETLDQAKRKAGEIYGQANRSLNQQYDKAVRYSRENPETATLIAFGVGVGVGMLVIGNLGGSRSRRGRVIEPVMNAISSLASELFR